MSEAQDLMENALADMRAWVMGGEDEELNYASLEDAIRDAFALLERAEPGLSAVERERDEYAMALDIIDQGHGKRGTWVRISPGLRVHARPGGLREGMLEFARNRLDGKRNFGDPYPPGEGPLTRQAEEGKA
jgi:hypothetical protein